MKDEAMPSLRGMTLTVTERCNLRCGYCYVPVDRGRTMNSDLIDAAVDLFARHAADTPEISLSFFGGEPFLDIALMQHAILKARERFPGDCRVRVATPTNGTLIEGERLEFCRKHGIELAISIDGQPTGGERRFPGGEDCAGRILPLLPGILALDSTARVTARMTVTPSNVDRLASSVAALADLGFRRIFYLPAYELAWDDAAVETWAREHRRIATWLVGLLGVGRRPPDLPAWRGIESRLTLGRTRRACGAGDRFVAVGADGAIFPCYRFLFAAENDAWRLGHVLEGFTNPRALATFKTIEPSLARPEEGDCAACPASDGCTFFCPALGHWLSRDPLAIPAVACRLTRAQVEVVRSAVALGRRLRPQRSPRSRWATAAVVAALVAGGGVLSSCGSGEPSPGDANDTVGDVLGDAAGDTTTEVSADDVPVGGLCPVFLDEEPDAATDPDSDQEEPPGPGLCPTPGIC